jgi:hypothetical protein
MERKRVLRHAALVLAALCSVAGAAETPVYVGAAKCKMCHLKEYNAWAGSRMAKSFELLTPGVAAELKTARGVDPKKDYRADASCLACHTTGYGKPGGFVDMAKTPHLAGVQCEVCHGPGGTYIQKKYMSLENKEYKRAELVKVGLTANIDKATCLACHNALNPFHPRDEEFDFDARMRKGVHPILPLKYQH